VTLLGAVLALCAFSLPATATGAHGVEVVVTAPVTRVDAAHPVVVRVAMTNSTPRAIAVPVWETPAHGVDAPIFSVARDGVPVPYVGMIAKRAAPTPDQRVTIEAGATVTYDADIGGAYAFASTGTYTVRYDVPEVGAASAPVSLEVTGRGNVPSRIPPNVAGRLGAQSLTTAGCDAGEETAASVALGEAGTYAEQAVNYFAANRAGGRYQYWFGTYAAGRWSDVAGHYARIADAATAAAVQIVCHDPSCDPGTYAFVYPDAPYVIYVCDAFWSAALTGTDSRAGTLIHEMSHFTVIAGTEDWVYGQAGAHALAGSSPTQAVNNADNHEYFAENTPATPDSAAAYTLSATGQDVGAGAVGTSVTGVPIVLTSTGDTALTIGALTVSGTEFVLESDTCSGATLAPAATCRFTARFTPSAGGTRSAVIGIPGNALAAPTDIALTGTGIAPPAPAPEAPPAAPAMLPPATPVVLPLRTSSSCGGRGGCAISGTLPPTATRIAVRAARKGRTARGTCAIAKATRVYRCGIALGPGRWSVTTDAMGPSGIVASSTVTKVVRARR
jgi:peptidyl-Lys metalloendopeptidase